MTDKETMDKFKKIRNYPTNSIFFSILIIIAGIVLSLIFRQPFIVLIFGIIAGFVYYNFAKKYKCPNCDAFLWNIPNKKEMVNCPKCNKKLQ